LICGGVSSTPPVNNECKHVKRFGNKIGGFTPFLYPKKCYWPFLSIKPAFLAVGKNEK
jgi:hypothetical protein